MIIEESRILQVSIFKTVPNNLRFVDCSLLLIDVMTIADEVDSRLQQTIVSYAESTPSIANYGRREPRDLIDRSSGPPGHSPEIYPAGP